MKFRQALFWDTDPKKINIKKNASYIIERILDLGKDSEVRWLCRTYSKRLLKNVVTHSRSIHPQTKNLWTILLKQK